MSDSQLDCASLSLVSKSGSFGLSLNFVLAGDYGTWYTCQHFLGQRCEIFIQWVPGFPKRIRPCPKFSEDVWSILRKFWTYPDPSLWTCFAKHNLIPNSFLVKTLRFWGKYRHLLILHGFLVSHIGLSLDILGKCVGYGCNNSQFSTRRENWFVSVSWREIEVFNSQAWDSRLRRESWQV